MPAPAFWNLSATLVVGARFQRRQSGHKGVVSLDEVVDDFRIVSGLVLQFFGILFQVVEVPTIWILDEPPVFPAYGIEVASRLVGGIRVVPEEVLMNIAFFLSLKIGDEVFPSQRSGSGLPAAAAAVA